MLSLAKCSQFGNVEGECATCLDTSINGDGVCATKYSACLADTGCAKLLKCYRECAKLTGDEYGACVSSVAGCQAGATEAQRTLAFEALDCACCNIGACRMECKQQCAPLDNPVFGPFSCSNR